MAENRPGACGAGAETGWQNELCRLPSVPGINAATPITLSEEDEVNVGSDGKHCLSEDRGKGLPRYHLTSAQRDSLIAFLKAPRLIGDDDGSLTLAALNCYACHERDGEGGPTPESHSFFLATTVWRTPGASAPLSGIGDKLKPEWLESILSGKQESRPRSYLQTQMPAYWQHASALSDLLVKVDATADRSPIVVRSDDLEAGRKLLGSVGGMNCITCHNWGEQRSLGVPALDISALNERLQASWFREYLLNPAQYRPGTLMPPLWPGGKSTVPDVLDGDAERQIAAIWSFIEEGEGVPEGFPDHKAGQFELIPTDRPIIQRTFLTGTGTKAILVGFPGEIHIAYDGFSAQPSLVWRGKFFDTYHTWYTREAPFENPLSDEVHALANQANKHGFLATGWTSLETQRSYYCGITKALRKAFEWKTNR